MLNNCTTRNHSILTYFCFFLRKRTQLTSAKINIHIQWWVWIAYLFVIRQRENRCKPQQCLSNELCSHTQNQFDTEVLSGSKILEWKKDDQMKFAVCNFHRLRKTWSTRNASRNDHLRIVCNERKLQLSKIVCRIYKMIVLKSTFWDMLFPET